jgi:hypothetical protein
MKKIAVIWKGQDKEDEKKQEDETNELLAENF